MKGSQRQKVLNDGWHAVCVGASQDVVAATFVHPGKGLQI